MRAEIDKNYQPERELVGDISQTLDFLLPYMKGYSVPEESKAYLDSLRKTLQKRDVPPEVTKDQVQSHPLSIIQAL